MRSCCRHATASQLRAIPAPTTRRRLGCSPRWTAPSPWPLSPTTPNPQAAATLGEARMARVLQAAPRHRPGGSGRPGRPARRAEVAARDLRVGRAVRCEGTKALGGVLPPVPGSRRAARRGAKNHLTRVIQPHQGPANHRSVRNGTTLRRMGHPMLPVIRQRGMGARPNDMPSGPEHRKRSSTVRCDRTLPNVGGVNREVVLTRGQRPGPPSRRCTMRGGLRC
jgi:hypothetical protein